MLKKWRKFYIFIYNREKKLKCEMWDYLLELKILIQTIIIWYDRQFSNTKYNYI
jgi:hypothetical protein